MNAQAVVEDCNGRNPNWRGCMKVQDHSDSNQLMKITDAAKSPEISEIKWARTEKVCG